MRLSGVRIVDQSLMGCGFTCLPGKLVLPSRASGLLLLASVTCLRDCFLDDRHNQAQSALVRRSDFRIFS